MKALRQIQAILALPFMVLIVIPTALIAQTRTLNPFWGAAFPFNILFAAAGICFSLCGLLLMVSTIRLFVTVGQGTLAPWTPTRRLVVVGPYRYVRNPMISGVIGVLLGEAVILGSVPIVVWVLIFVLINLTYIPLVEEPGLSERFGDEYREYTQHVPRWIPRRTAWWPPEA